MGRRFLIQKTPTGEFRLPAAGAEMLLEAYTLDERSGELTGARDAGLDGQRDPCYFTELQHYAQPQAEATVLLARFAPTDFYGFVGSNDQPVIADVVDADFMSALRQFSVVHDWEFGATVLAAPGSRFYVLQKGYPHYRYYYHGPTRETQGFLMGHQTRVRGSDRAVPADGRGAGVPGGGGPAGLVSRGGRGAQRRAPE